MGNVNKSVPSSSEAGVLSLPASQETPEPSFEAEWLKYSDGSEEVEDKKATAHRFFIKGLRQGESAYRLRAEGEWISVEDQPTPDDKVHERILLVTPVSDISRRLDCIAWRIPTPPAASKPEEE